MPMSINQARSHEATRNFISFRAEEPEPHAPTQTSMTDDEWLSLSPGFRREISRQFNPKPEVEQPVDRQKALKERKAAVEYAGRKRL